MTSNVNETLKTVLACPKCKTQEMLEWRETEILCHRCQLSYRIEEGIPVMLVEEAKPL
jgi:uncharacterized protein YbaR (Trm112 family)